MKLDNIRLRRMLKTIFKFGYIFTGLWLIGGVVFAILDRVSFGEALWLILLCLINQMPDKLSDTVRFSEKIIIVLFDILGMVFIGLLIGHITSFLVDSVIRIGKPLKKTAAHKLKNHIVFLGIDETVLSILKTVESFDFYLSSSILVVTNRDDFVSNLPFMSNLFLIKGDPLSTSNWKLADLQFAKGIYVACEGDVCSEDTIHNGRKIYLELAAALIQQYLEDLRVDNVSIITNIGFLDDETQLFLPELTGEELQIFRERKLSDYIVASNVISDKFDKIINEMLLSFETPSILVKSNFKGYNLKTNLYDLKKSLLKQNILLVGYIRTVPRNKKSRPEVILNPSIFDLKSHNLSDTQELILLGNCSLENDKLVLTI